MLTGYHSECPTVGAGVGASAGVERGCSMSSRGSTYSTLEGHLVEWRTRTHALLHASAIECRDEVVGIDDTSLMGGDKLRGYTIGPGTYHKVGDDRLASALVVHTC